jgi:predicted RNA-binding Zn-ribbon protein involved in translation (DUF1610 family)
MRSIVAGCGVKMVSRLLRVRRLGDRQESERVRGEGVSVGQLARLNLAAAPACPNCRERITNLDLDNTEPGDEHQCLLCGHVLRIPGAVLERLRAQRAELGDLEEPQGLLSRVMAWLRSLFAG